jgi:two-component system response regulator DesR
MDRGTTIRILCIDDHDEIRRLFELVLRDHADLQTVGGLASAEGLEESLHTLHPHVVVLDLSMPGPHPLRAMKTAKTQHPEVQFLVSSSYDDSATIQEALNSGATGYLMKEGAFDSLADAIRRVAKGEKVVPPSAQR